MTSSSIGDDHGEIWLRDAGRQLDPTDEQTRDATRLLASITDHLPRARRPGRPLLTDSPGVWISDRVLTQLVAVQVRRSVGRLVVGISAEGSDGRVERIRLGLVARYHDILPEESDLIRDVVTEVLTSLLGPEQARTASDAIDVRWTDLDTGA